MPDALYLPDGDRFVATELTRGPWDPAAQHGGPPSALLGRVIERCEPRASAMIARITFEFVRPVPIAALWATAEVVRSGRSVDLLTGSLSDERGEVLRVTACRLRTEEVEVGAAATRAPPPPAPETARAEPFFETGSEVGWHRAIEARFVAGRWLEAGPAAAWFRLRVPLVAGEEPSPLQRVLVVADAGNGISAVLPWDRFLFVNTDLTVHLHRLPAGEWVCLDAETSLAGHGVGLAQSALSDTAGAIGRSCQTLFVAARGA